MPIRQRQPEAIDLVTMHPVEVMRPAASTTAYL